MTKVKAKSSDKRYEITAKGHATGSEKVCAAISGLIYAIAGYLQNSDEVSDITLRLDSGDAEVSFSGGKVAKAIFTLAVIGFMQIEASHPEYISVETNIF